jgi:hypothetical protein
MKQQYISIREQEAEDHRLDQLEMFKFFATNIELVTKKVI